MRIVALTVLVLLTSGCASTLDRLETATGPDAYWINNVPPDVAKLEAEQQKHAFYNQPAMRVYLRFVPFLPVIIFGGALALPTYVPPIVP